MAISNWNGNGASGKRKEIPSPEEARRLFPRGLLQPATSFRFSADSLLLACFLSPGPGERILDLGTGCGVVALALLCREVKCRATGVDIQQELIGAARTNAARLGFSGSFTGICADLADPSLFQRISDASPCVSGHVSLADVSGHVSLADVSGHVSLADVSGHVSLADVSGHDSLAGVSGHDSLTGGSGHDSLAGGSGAGFGLPGDFARLGLTASPSASLAPASFSLVLANPPYRQGHAGRLPASLSRRRALFEEPDSLRVFCTAAAQALTLDGRFGVIYPFPRRDELLAALKEAELFPFQALPLASRQGATPSLLLLEARKRAAGPGPHVFTEPPLVLHEGQGRQTRLTKAALNFCPFLACAASPPGLGAYSDRFPREKGSISV